MASFLKEVASTAGDVAQSLQVSMEENQIYWEKLACQEAIWGWLDLFHSHLIMKAVSVDEVMGVYQLD